MYAAPKATARRRYRHRRTVSGRSGPAYFPFAQSRHDGGLCRAFEARDPVDERKGPEHRPLIASNDVVLIPGKRVALKEKKASDDNSQTSADAAAKWTTSSRSVLLF
jgi:hypothetical protein